MYIISYLSDRCYIESPSFHLPPPSIQGHPLSHRFRFIPFDRSTVERFPDGSTIFFLFPTLMNGTGESVIHAFDPFQFQF